MLNNFQMKTATLHDPHLSFDQSKRVFQGEKTRLTLHAGRPWAKAAKARRQGPWRLSRQLGVLVGHECGLHLTMSD